MVPTHIAAESADGAPNNRSKSEGSSISDALASLSRTRSVALEELDTVLVVDVTTNEQYGIDIRQAGSDRVVVEFVSGDARFHLAIQVQTGRVPQEIKNR